MGPASSVFPGQAIQEIFTRLILLLPLMWEAASGHLSRLLRQIPLHKDIPDIVIRQQFILWKLSEIFFHLWTKVLFNVVALVVFRPVERLR